MRSSTRGLLARIPTGVALSQEDWELRHKWIVRLLWLQVPIIAIYALARASSPLHTAADAAPVALFAVLSHAHRLTNRERSVLASIGLMMSSAVIVHVSGGMTEMHFHFFVMIGVISLYQDWRPFLFSIAFVAAHHGLVGIIRPRDVFDQGVAWRQPLLFAGVHALFVLCASAVAVSSWSIIETAHRRARAALEASERRFRSLIENAADAVTVLSADGTILYDSPSSADVFGQSPAERLGRNAFDFVHPADIAQAAELLANVLTEGSGSVSVSIRVIHADGSYRWVEGHVNNRLADEAVGGIVVNFRDVTDRKALEDQLAHQAFHDPLTGLANRALLLDRVDHAVAQRRRSAAHLAVIYLDLDDFKTVNDGLGHEAGDQLLRAVAGRISSVVRPGDTASRLGGDEFAVLLENLPNPAMAYEIGGRLLEALHEPFDLCGGVVVNASIGIAVATENEDAAGLLRNADLAMYRAKNAGKGRFEIYEAGMHAQVLARMELKTDLRRALEAGEFVPVYQPIVDLDTGIVNGVEALLRWHHRDGRVISPAEFIPVAEETGLIVQIGSCVLHQACRDAAAWRDELGDAAPRTVSVNLSPRQIQDAGLVEDVRMALELSGLDPSALLLEITESVLVDDTELAASTLGQLKALGVGIALDDFGTGYSSLTYLDLFPVDVLKIDKSFIDSLVATQSDGSPLVAAIVNLGTMLGLRVTAEGIEGARQLERLQGMGCQQGQGYYFAKPMPPAEITRFLRDPALARAAVTAAAATA